MNRSLISALLLLSTSAVAQNPQMNQQQMQAMMGQMQEVQKCLQQVDQARMEALGERAQKMDAEIKKLCAEGKRDEAMETALTFGREMSSDPDMKLMRKCTEGMEGMMPQMPYADSPKELGGGHICDK
jgi:type II secretory pathway component PulJ